MAEGWAHHFAKQYNLEADIWSAGTEATKVKTDAITVMQEVGVDLSNYSSKTLYDLPDPWNFDYVITVCDSAAEACPAYPANTKRLHYPFTDPSGHGLEAWRIVRDQLKEKIEALVVALNAQKPVPESYTESLPVGL
jgi:arsenate reductase (thioredoxin)